MNARILIVDDSLTVRMDLAEAFEHSGLEVRLCADLSQARAALAEGGVSLIVLDALLPDGHGVDLLAEIRGALATASIPVILLSAETEVKSRIAGLETGANDYLGKPYEAVHVVRRARELLGIAEPSRERNKVLVIDDSLTFCEEMREQLQAGGYAAELAATGEEGLKRAAEIQPDAIIIDGMLPGMDGATVVRRIRLDPVLQRTPCLFLTGSDTAADEVAALEAGADAYIRKSESTRMILGRLSALIRTAIHGRQHIELIGSAGPRKVMLVSRGEANAQWIPPILRQEHYDTLVSGSEEEAFRLLTLQPVDCVLLDADTAESPIADLCRRLRSSPLLEQVPIVALSRESDSQRVIAAFSSGVDDWIAADQRQPKLLLARLRALLRRKEVDDRERRIRQVLSQRAYELEQANQELREYAEVIEHMPLGVSVARWEDRTDPDSLRILWTNAAGAEPVGAEPESFLGRPVGDCFPELIEAGLREAYGRALEEQAPQRLTQMRWGGEQAPLRACESLVAPVGLDKIVILTQDVTVRVKAEAGRREMEEQMRAAQRMEAVGKLAGGIAHDFNNVLTVILSYAGFLRDDLQDNQEVVEDLDVIREAADKAARLTSQLLAFSRRQPRAIEIVDLSDTVAELDKMLQRLIGEDVDLVTRLSPELGLVETDVTQIEQVLMNLAVNARDAMPTGGRLTIETANVTLDESYAGEKPAEIPAGEYVMIACSDTGCGMDAATRARIFEPFFTTKEQGRGTGLGLATVYGIVKQNNGFIWVYSELGRGTTFKIYLPRAQASQSTSAGPAALAPVTGGSETILLVEDEEPLRSAARRILTRNGYALLEAANGAEAIRICEEHRGRIDLVLTDVVMPEMSGKELVERLAAIEPHVLVVYMSGYTDNAIVHHGVLDAGTVFLQKPFSPDALLRIVRKVLDTRG